MPSSDRAARLYSIGGKITFLVLAVAVVSSLLTVIFVPAGFERNERKAFAERANAEAALLADAVAPALEFEQLDAAEDTLRWGLADNVVSYVALYGPDGRRTLSVAADGTRARPPARIEGADTADRLSTSAIAVGAAGVGHDGAARSLGTVVVALRTDLVVADVSEMQRNIVLLALLGAVIGLVLGAWLSSRIAAPLRRVTQAAERIADGELHGLARIDAGRDEVGTLASVFTSMTTRLRELVLSIRVGSDALATAAARMSKEVREQESLATKQSASLEQIRGSLAVLSTAAEQVETDAETVRKMADTSLSASQEIAERTRLVSTHSDRIGEILQFIQDIADRSDLLALNAALEGAKAGDVGRGFSLVAAEMRRLSEHVKDSVRDIRKLVADMRESSSASVSATQDGIRLARETSAAAEKISALLVRHREGTGQVKDGAEEIVVVMGESLRGRAGTTASAEALLTLSHELKQAVSQFRLGEAEGKKE